MWKAVGVLLIAGGMLSVSLFFDDARAVGTRAEPVVAAVPAADTPAPPSPAADATPSPAASPTPVPPVAPRSFATLAAAVDAITAAGGATVGVSLVELGGTAPSSWSSGGETRIDAASTYKLAALEEEAQLVAAGKVDPSGQVCFQDGDYEDGWFDDYGAGSCFTRAELARRAGIFSDNTAGHMLVRDLGGPDALNAYAAGLGATASTFYDPNQTTADDLAALLVAEATGRAGGSAAMSWLYPNLSHTNFEAGIPAGLPAGALVIHKTGDLDAVVNDAGIVTGGSAGPYVLTVMTDGAGGDAGWSLVAQVSAAVWAYEEGR